MGLEPVSAPDAAHSRFAHSRPLRHRAGAPVSRVRGFGRRGQLYNPPNLPVSHRARTSRSWSVFNQSLPAAVQKPISPAGRLLRGNAEFRRNLTVLKTVGRTQNDARSLH